MPVQLCLKTLHSEIKIYLVRVLSHTLIFLYCKVYPITLIRQSLLRALSKPNRIGLLELILQHRERRLCKSTLTRYIILCVVKNSEKHLLVSYRQQLLSVWVKIDVILTEIS